MESKEKQDPKRLHVALVLFLSFLVCALSVSIEQSLRWSDHWSGFAIGLFNGFLVGVASCVMFVLPWSLVIMWLYNWKHWKRFRTQWMFVPSIFVSIMFLSNLLSDPPTPSHRFKKFTEVELPADTKNISNHFQGGGIADGLRDNYYFEISPTEVERLVSEMRLTVEENADDKKYSNYLQSLMPSCPEFSSWQDAEQFTGWNKKKSLHFRLITNSSKTKVYVLIRGN